ncbi:MULTISPECIES: DUF6482 family protein [Pseudomonadaceae]|jgi:hypothetical protein|uniref:Cation transporter n=2 Tax=Ectopseudomonas TaxID=3236654 RepID=A4XRK2_ECTM1|nr:MULTISPECIES: DUF6482 family protein [Pseudomonas]ARS47973.1 cation transporter [Pseudomonas mendocina]EJO94907.1 hypothetical protein A471_04755 [Pseudomonas mendocina DLHK]ATH83281.1 cation transporter [Pseudomonas mendocina]MBA4244261.1 ribosome biogenesis GTPase YlqF [Pseudomonas sp.]MBF8163476.1 cation transporter [Pseudomonas mendocina]
MNLHDLSTHAQAGRIDELNLISLEGGIYLLEARMEGRAHPILDEQGSTLNLRSVEHARDVLQEMPTLPFFLVHSSVHDEMCGMPSADNSLRVPIAIRSSW